MRKKIHIHRLSIVTVIAVMMLLGNTIFAESIEDVEDEINQIEKEKDKLKKDQGDLDEDKADTDSKMDENESQKASAEDELETITNELESTQASIDSKQSEITETNEKIEKLSKQVKQLKKDIKKLKQRIKERDELLKSRMISLQKSGGGVQYMEVLFGSQSFGDFISRSSAVTTIMDQDEKILEIHMQDKSDLETKQVAVEEKSEEVESKKATLETQKDELVALKETLDSQKDEQDSLIAQLETEYEELTEYKVSIEEEKEILAAETEALEKAQQVAVDRKSELEQLAKKREEEERARRKAEEEKARREAEEEKRQLAAQKEKDTETIEQEPEEDNSPPDNNIGNVDFIRPVSGGVTSPYGYRTHPVTGEVLSFHSGVDLAAGEGTTLRAAAPGVVSITSSLSTYGNTIMITHVIDGQEYTTLYAHLSSYSVSPGQVVEQGEVIGKTGSTGRVTGPHLHFEIYKGSFGGKNRVNPIDYLP